MAKPDIKNTQNTNAIGVVCSALVRLFCWIRGHDMMEEYHLTNTANGGTSDWGSHKCLRCGRTEDWQYDR